MAITLPAFVSILEDFAPAARGGLGQHRAPARTPGLEPIESILLTIDLTEAVVAEALKARATAILAYHPPIFGGLRKLTQEEPMMRALSRALVGGIAIYSPHTALDCCEAGVNDWLAEGLGSGRVQALRPWSGLAPDEVETRPRLGQGRRVELDQPLPLDELLVRIKDCLGLDQVRVAAADRHAAGAEIATILLCAGAGGSVLEGQEGELLWTGEMRHHEVLAHREAGRSVVLCEHTNTERGYLARLREILAELLDGRARVLVSEADRDPLSIR